MRKNEPCEYGNVFGECDGKHTVRVARHLASEDGGETTHPICSLCLSFFYCSVEGNIDTFGHFNPHTCEESETPFKHLVLEDFNLEQWTTDWEKQAKKENKGSL